MWGGEGGVPKTRAGNFTCLSLLECCFGLLIMCDSFWNPFWGIKENESSRVMREKKNKWLQRRQWRRYMEGHCLREGVWWVRYMVMGGVMLRDYNVQSTDIPIPFLRGGWADDTAHESLAFEVDDRWWSQSSGGLKFWVQIRPIWLTISDIWKVGALICWISYSGLPRLHWFCGQLIFHRTNCPHCR